MPEFRVGCGYDFHRLEAGRRLVLGGVHVPAERGLAGHSDADVVCHALADAILGAIGAGDIGRLFPPGDPKWKDANSLDLLERVWDEVRARGGRLINADVVIVAEGPPLAPHAAAMQARIAARLGSPPERVSIKATTNEALGPEGRGEGISASAVCLVELP